MTFDIHSIDHLELDDDEDYAKFDDYQAELLGLFENSPEGQQHREKYPNYGWWIGMFMDYALKYQGCSIPRLQLEDVDELLTDVLIRKISLQKREEALDAIPELVAFWKFIKREFHTRNAGPILKYLETCSPDEFADAMFDPRQAGMAKSFFMQGNAAGFDMTDKKQIDRFMVLDNLAKLLHLKSDKTPKNEENLLPMEDVEAPDTEAPLSMPLFFKKAQNKDDTKEKKKRKAEKAARKRNKKK
jgi:hypothetical protein